MSKIYDEQGTRMTNEQVATALKGIIPQAHINVLATAIKGNSTNGDGRRVFAHAVVDAYKFMAADTPEQEKSKKWSKYLMDKYMKSPTPSTAAEEKAMQELIAHITSSAKVETEE